MNFVAPGSVAFVHDEGVVMALHFTSLAASMYQPHRLGNQRTEKCYGERVTFKQLGCSCPLQTPFAQVDLLG